ncbi:unnamed protein product [Amoebophrya sp. A120]|nr:unnamed protein product [Amoebophrya sp. A120]|eukprot:GSA120T00024225001.1
MQRGGAVKNREDWPIADRVEKLEQGGQSEGTDEKFHQGRQKIVLQNAKVLSALAKLLLQMQENEALRRLEVVYDPNRRLVVPRRILRIIRQTYRKIVHHYAEYFGIKVVSSSKTDEAASNSMFFQYLALGGQHIVRRGATASTSVYFIENADETVRWDRYFARKEKMFDAAEVEDYSSGTATPAQEHSSSSSSTERAYKHASVFRPGVYAEGYKPWNKFKDPPKVLESLQFDGDGTPHFFEDDGEWRFITRAVGIKGRDVERESMDEHMFFSQHEGLFFDENGSRKTRNNKQFMTNKPTTSSAILQSEPIDPAEYDAEISPFASNDLFYHFLQLLQILQDLLFHRGTCPWDAADNRKRGYLIKTAPIVPNEFYFCVNPFWESENTMSTQFRLFGLWAECETLLDVVTKRDREKRQKQNDSAGALAKTKNECEAAIDVGANYGACSMRLATARRSSEAFEWEPMLFHGAAQLAEIETTFIGRPGAYSGIPAPELAQTIYIPVLERWLPSSAVSRVDEIRDEGGGGTSSSSTPASSETRSEDAKGAAEQLQDGAKAARNPNPHLLLEKMLPEASNGDGRMSGIFVHPFLTEDVYKVSSGSSTLEERSTTCRSSGLFSLARKWVDSSDLPFSTESTSRQTSRSTSVTPAVQLKADDRPPDEAHIHTALRNIKTGDSDSNSSSASTSTTFFPATAFDRQKKRGTGYQVVAVEPVHWNTAFTGGSIKANHLEHQVKLFQAAATSYELAEQSAEEKLVFSVPHQDTELGGLFSKAQLNVTDDQQRTDFDDVPLRTLDEIVNTAGSKSDKSHVLAEDGTVGTKDHTNNYKGQEIQRLAAVVYGTKMNETARDDDENYPMVLSARRRSTSLDSTTGTTLNKNPFHFPVQNLCLLKTDTEGHDHEVAQGARELLKKMRIEYNTLPVVSAEINADAQHRIYRRTDAKAGTELLDFCDANGFGDIVSTAPRVTTAEELKDEHRGQQRQLLPGQVAEKIVGNGSAGDSSGENVADNQKLIAKATRTNAQIMKGHDADTLHLKYEQELGRSLPFVWFLHAQWSETMSDAIADVKLEFFENNDNNSLLKVERTASTAREEHPVPVAVPYDRDSTAEDEERIRFARVTVGAPVTKFVSSSSSQEQLSSADAFTSFAKRLFSLVIDQTWVPPGAFQDLEREKKIQESCNSNSVGENSDTAATKAGAVRTCVLVIDLSAIRSQHRKWRLQVNEDMLAKRAKASFQFSVADQDAATWRPKTPRLYQLIPSLMQLCWQGCADLSFSAEKCRCLHLKEHDLLVQGEEDTSATTPTIMEHSTSQGRRAASKTCTLFRSCAGARPCAGYGKHAPPGEEEEDTTSAATVEMSAREAALSSLRSTSSLDKNTLKGFDHLNSTEEVETLLEVFGRNPLQGFGSVRPHRDHAHFVDCATAEFGDTTLAWPKEEFRHEEAPDLRGIETSKRLQEMNKCS